MRFNFNKRIIDRIKQNPYVIIFWAMKYSGISKISDYVFIKTSWRLYMGYNLNLKNPKTFSEKLSWMKLYDRNPLYTKLVDKFAVKEFVTSKIGSEYVIPTLGVWDRAEDIDFENLPGRFVLKCTHDSGSVMLCKDKSSLNINEVREKYHNALLRDYYHLSIEWPYKNVPHRVIAEQFIDTPDEQLVDYKFYCFNGYVDCVMVCIERNTGNPKFYFFDKDWNLLRLNYRGLEVPKDFTIPKPENMDRMFEIACELSKGLPYVRVDLYNVQGSILFGELTFYPSGGYDSRRLDSTELRWGNLINLPHK